MKMAMSPLCSTIFSAGLRLLLTAVYEELVLMTGANAALRLGRVLPCTGVVHMYLHSVALAWAATSSPGEGLSRQRWALETGSAQSVSKQGGIPCSEGDVRTLRKALYCSDNQFII